jgi:hypothetical protein
LLVDALGSDMHQTQNRERRMFPVMAAFGALVLLSGLHSKLTPPTPTAVELHRYGFPSGAAPADSKVGIVYLSGNRLALFFNHKVPSSGEDSHSFQLLILNIDGRVLAQRGIDADPKAMDVTAGPNGGLLLGRRGQLDFFDGDLQLLKTVLLSDPVTGISFDRKLNQLVEMTVDDASQTRSAHFLDGNTLEPQLILRYPIKSVPVFGEKQLGYSLGGNCVGSAHIVSNQHDWLALTDISACDLLTFVGNDAIAYAFDKRLYVLDWRGKQILNASFPAPDTFQLPRFVGISDDQARLAISALAKKKFAASGVWPYYDEVFVYDLKAKRMILRYALPVGSWVRPALSPDGHQLAVVEEGILRLIPIS